jgi:radical SAM superfamily enzyme YgiQ (UPF0313 family)
MWAKEGLHRVRVHIINPSDLSFGIGVITPRWLYVLAAATPGEFGDPILTDETLERFDPDTIQKGDIVGIGIHTANAYRGFELGRILRERGAWVVYGGIHATLYPQEAHERGGAHAVVRGDGDVVWGQVIRDCVAGQLQSDYDGGRVSGGEFRSARWDLMPPKSYMWASVQTVRGCPKHCSFCSVWRTDGQAPRQRTSDAVIHEVVQLRRVGYRFIALADDNFYPVSLGDIALARKQNKTARLEELISMREERFELMRRLAELPSDMVFFTQITMEAAEDTEFLDAMKRAHIRGALVGIESVTPEGLKEVYKQFNSTGADLAPRLQTFRQHGVHVLGSFIFGLATDKPETFDATVALAKQADLTFAQFVMMTPFPGTVDFERWEKNLGDKAERIDNVPVNRYWLLPGHRRPKLYFPHPKMSGEEIRQRTQAVWDEFYGTSEVWRRSKCATSLKARLAFVFISKLYRQMYANTGIATDSARRQTSTRWARWLARPCRRLFEAKALPDLKVPGRPATTPAFEIVGQ